ncbi:molybdopterin-dependent oxidoreductase [Desulfonatronovibrio hydrogenovorans]|uniref:molybdopterin-dependent oxidoreductase n=1 Tax=Desulfonatronovibrio hydrogenovorans TaxID=53245 RepID=UPI00048CA69C|nr:molybdopterin-dependent oxidoreductase [Desulfonatronovibrio hydrogenovorans]
MNFHSACILDCPDACSFVVDKEKKSIRGNPDHPITQGFVCAKGRNFFRRLDSPERITSPLLRKGNDFLPVSWDQALDLAALHLNRLRSTPEKILHVRGYGYRGVLAQASLNFFQTLNSATTFGSLCDEAGIEACNRDFGSLNHNDPLDLLNAEYIVNWGKDYSRSSPHTAALISKAARSGTRIITISPGGQKPDLADRSILIRPGTDRFLAAAIIKMFMDAGLADRMNLDRASNHQDFLELLRSLNLSDLLSACHVSEDTAREVFQIYARSGPTASLIGWGLQRHLYGGENVRFINALAMISGNIGIRGGGSYFNVGSGRNLGSWTASTRDQPKGEVKRPRLALFNLGREIADSNPEIEFIWIDGHNVVNQVPDSSALIKAFKARFIVCVDGFFNDTALRSDLILPPAFMLEKEEVLGSCLHDYVNYSGKILEPRGGCRSDFDILQDLGHRLFPAVTFPRPDQCLQTGLEKIGVSLEEIRSRGFLKGDAPDIAFQDMIFDHPDQLYSFPRTLSREPAPDPGYPLRLLSLIQGKYMHSQIPEQDQTGLPMVSISSNNPLAACLDLSKKTFLVTPLGRLEVGVKVVDNIHPEAVIIPRDGWIKHGHNPNILIQSRSTDMGWCAAYYSQTCCLIQE